MTPEQAEAIDRMLKAQGAITPEAIHAVADEAGKIGKEVEVGSSSPVNLGDLEYGQPPEGYDKSKPFLALRPDKRERHMREVNPAELTQHPINIYPA